MFARTLQSKQNQLSSTVGESFENNKKHLLDHLGGLTEEEFIKKGYGKIVNGKLEHTEAGIDFLVSKGVMGRVSKGTMEGRVNSELLEGANKSSKFGKRAAMIGAGALALGGVGYGLYKLGQNNKRK